jgi:ankyrin repeat protein
MFSITCSHPAAGSPNLDFFKAMHAEHMTRCGHDFVFVTGNYKLRTKVSQEWLYVVGDESGRRIDPSASDMGHDRVIKPIEELLQKPLAKSAKLTREEMIAIVLYTGPAFVIYNAVLRRFPTDIYQVLKDGDNLFPTTIFVLVSAINKLSRCMNIPPGTLLYRGLGGTLEFPDRFTRADPKCVTPNALGFLEYGFMSTSANKNVAVGYSGVKEGKPKAIILQIHPNAIDRGADISEFSQYPGEKEFLFVPYSFIQGEGNQRTEVVDGGGVLTVVPVRVNINLKTETVEELQEKKKRLHLASARAMIDELRFELGNWAASVEAAQRLQQDVTRNQNGTSTAFTLAENILEQCEAVFIRHDVSGVELYINDGVFRALVNEMLDAKAWAKEKKELWMRDSSQYICFLNDFSLRECHRLWQSFLRKTIDRESLPRTSTSIELLMSRGLVKQSVCGEVNADGEDVMVQAGGDGWAAGDIVAAAAAGADACATDCYGCSGVWNAARYGYLESMVAILEAKGDVNGCTKSGSSPIFAAAANGHSACITQLVLFGGDTNMFKNNGASPICAAAEKGHADCIRTLVISRGDVNACTNDGASPVYHAAANGHVACILELVSSGGDVNKCNYQNASPIWVAAENGHAACITQLVLCGGCVHTCHTNGASPIYTAAQNGHALCIQELVCSGGDVNACDTSGTSPIWIAAQNGHADCIAQLLSSLADPRSSWNGLSAINQASQKGYWDCVHLLEAALM